MFKILTRNQISPLGLGKFPSDHYQVGEGVTDPDAILLRSFKLAESDLSDGLLAVGRAGAGVNNIPVPACTDRGIVVFNTPGANANAVKELVCAAMLLSARGIVEGIQYVNGLAGTTDHAELSQLVEGSKKNYKGNEIAGKTLGVIGLGAIGSMVAEMGINLGMNVLGHDPMLSVDGAWRVARGVTKMDSLSALLARSDLVTLHVPASAETREMIGAAALEQCKHGAVLINFARAELVGTQALAAALESGRIRRYVTDFPAPELIGIPGAIQIPHLGASTDEAEDNCAMMVADQVLDFLENGNITNSVNFPALQMERTGAHRIAVTNRNVPRILNSVTSLLAERDINVVDMSNRSRDEIAYNLIDMDKTPDSALLGKIRGIDGVVGVRGVSRS